MPLKYSSSCLSDVGLVRSNNEDSFGEHTQLPLFVLADGMGGHQAGEVASKEAVDAFLRLVGPQLENSETPPERLAEEIERAIELVNTIVYTIGMSDERLRGMGTTLCSLAFREKRAIVVHAGDSRIYRLRKGVLERLTKDHTLAFQLLEKGEISQGDESFLNYKNVITKAIGSGQLLNPTVQIIEIDREDRFLLCSDGLTDMVTDVEIAAILTSLPRLSECARELVFEAKRQGGADNITVMVIQVDNV